MKFLDLYEAKFYQRRLHPEIALPEQNGGYGGAAVRRMRGIRVFTLL